MMEEPGIIQMNVDRYSEMLSLLLDDDTRARVEQLLGEAKRQLALAIGMKDSRPDLGKARCPGSS